jgi:hypothetical protein
MNIRKFRDILIISIDSALDCIEDMKDITSKKKLELFVMQLCRIMDDWTGLNSSYLFYERNKNIMEEIETKIVKYTKESTNDKDQGKWKRKR